MVSPKGRHRRPLDPADSIWTFRGVVLTTAGFVGFIGVSVLVAVLSRLSSSSSSSSSNISGFVFNLPSDIPSSVVDSLDAVLVLGGGVPTSLFVPPIYVQKRCDDAADVVRRRRLMHPLPVLSLSAGTVHLPQLLADDGLPIYESTSSAAYLQQQHHLDHLYVETTSYDTIGNAFYARTSHTDLNGWRTLLIVTNEFHMARSKAIFQWIFGIGSNHHYRLYFLSSPNVGLSDDAVEARRQREATSLQSVQRMSQSMHSLLEVWKFLTHQHDLYTASKLIERGGSGGHLNSSSRTSDASDLVKKSYGK